MRLTIILLATLALLGGGHAAFAHAVLRHAQPPVGASVKAAPEELLLIFSESIETAFTSVTVTDAGGARVDIGSVHTDPKDGTHLVVGLRKLAPGTYKVVWRVTAVDTHKSEGSYVFTVQP
jgi:hypothetical protein